jgi:uncharacterized membrane protein HdeD (DUF308 family)
VSSADVTPTHARRYWPWVLVRALPAAVIAVVITFTADHSTLLGFTSFGAFALVSGVAVAIGAFRALDSGVLRLFSLAQGLLGVVAGIVALAFTGAGLPFLIFLVGTWAALTGFIELYLGVRSRSRIASARDWIFAGGLTVLFAVAALLVPADFTQTFTGPDEVERQLTASIIFVGFIGAYGAILAVYLVIAGLSLKWADRPVAAQAAESGSHRGTAQ